MSVHRGHYFMYRKLFKITHTHTQTYTESCMVQNQHSNIFPCMNDDHSKKENKKTILFILFKPVLNTIFNLTAHMENAVGIAYWAYR